jgi:hypothetical protein
MKDEWITDNQSPLPKNKLLVYAFYVGLILLFLFVAYVGVQQCCLLKY